MSKRNAERASSFKAGDNKRSKTNSIRDSTLDPISFQVLRVEYVPEDDHRFYVEGRSSDPSVGGVCAVTSFSAHFFMESKEPFPNANAVQDFLDNVQRHISTLEKVTVSNVCGGDAYKSERFDSNLGWSGCKRWSKVSDNLKDFCVCWETDSTHKTFAHWMPEDEHLDLIKVTVRAPYMTQALHTYFESEEFICFLNGMYGNENHRIRTFAATVDPAAFFCLETGIDNGRWCTVSAYSLFGPRSKRTYHKTNLLCNTEDIACDLNSVEQSPTVTLAFDCEMVSKKDLLTGRHRYLFEDFSNPP